MKTSAVGGGLGRLAVLALAASACAGCSDNAAATAHEWAVAGLAKTHAQAIDCVESVLGGDLDADNVPGGATQWQDCFRLGANQESASDLMAAGLPIEDGSWLLSSTPTAAGTSVTALDVAYASVAQGSGGPVDAVVASCWTATVSVPEGEFERPRATPCPDGVIDAVGGSATEINATATPSA